MPSLPKAKTGRKAFALPRRRRRQGVASSRDALGAGAGAGAVPDGSATTSILVGNLHCPTCVSTIRDVLQEACAGHIRWVSPNIVTSVVTVEHDAAVGASDLTDALAAAGFEICGVTSTADQDSGMEGPGAQPTDETGKTATDKGKHAAPATPAAPASSSASWAVASLVRWAVPSVPHVVAQAHLANCEQCRLQHERGEVPVHQESITPVGDSSSSTAVDSRKAARRRPGKGRAESEKKNEKGDTNETNVGMSFVTVENEDAPANRPTWRAQLAIGGMTCAVCVNTISDELRKHDWVSNVSVNLIANSAVVDVDDEARAAAIVEIVEDLGYDAAVDSVVRIDPPKKQQATKTWKKKQTKDDDGDDDDVSDTEGDSDNDETPPRTVEIRIDGLYCEHCPDRVIRSLAGFRRASLAVVTKPTVQRPLLKLTYVPDAPRFTIRQILAAIEASDAALTAAVHHPPSLEERSRRIQAAHRRQLRNRVLLTLAAAVPTFIIGIVYMSLLPASNAGRQYLTKPWTSGLSRAQVALCILATPVYFFAASVFHGRALREVRALWRHGSRTPVWQRFYRFGSMNTLMSLGTTIAYVSSVCEMLAAAGAHRQTGVSDGNFYFDSVVFLTLFLLCGRYIESYSKARTGDAVEMLGRLRPTTAILVEGETTTLELDDKNDKNEQNEKLADAVSVGSADTTAYNPVAPPPVDDKRYGAGREVAADLLDFGDVVRVVHGASPPADGVVVQGRTTFDEASLTGEARPVPKAVGDAVFAGTVNKDAAVLVRLTTGATGGSMLDQIVAVVREGQTKRAPMEQIADLLTTYFVPVVTLVAIVTWLVWLLLGVTGRLPEEYLEDDGKEGSPTPSRWVVFSLQFAIAVFVVACPCGLGLAAPTALFVAGGLAAQHGILAKGGGGAFETASRVDCVVFDKTGTLTMGGAPTVTDSLFPGEDNNDRDAKKLLLALRAVEETSGHPIAKAVVAYCDAALTAADRAAAGHIVDLQEVAGRGMRAVYQPGSDCSSVELLVGNEKLLAEAGVAVAPAVGAQLRQWQEDAKSVALVGVRRRVVVGGESPGDWTLAAAFSVSDPLRPEAAALVAALQRAGVRVCMLSGDNARTAAAVARQLGIAADEVIAEVLPTDKAAQVQILQQAADGKATRRVVAMVGDGINDAPALTQADVGIAIGSGSDVAIASAAFVLVQADLRAVATLLALSRTVFRRIAFNFAWALVYNVLAVPIAAGALFALRTGASRHHVRLDPVWASLAMALSSISVVLSSLALRSGLPGVGFRAPVV